MTSRLSSLLRELERIATRLGADPSPATSARAAVDLRALVDHERRHEAMREAVVVNVQPGALPLPGEKGPTP